MQSTKMQTFLLKATALLGIWIVLTQTFQPFYLGVGLIASVAIARLNTSREFRSTARMHWLRTLMYIPWLLFKVIQSGIHVAYLVLHPRLPINPKIIRYQSNLPQPWGIVMLGNSITLTPGTITASVDSSELVVHAIDDQSGDDLTSLRLERKLARAFGDQQ